MTLNKTADTKEYMKKYNKKYYAKNSEKIKASHQELIRCETCSKDVKKAFWARHKRTKKHLQNEELNDLEKVVTEAVLKVLRQKSLK